MTTSRVARITLLLLLAAGWPVPASAVAQLPRPLAPLTLDPLTLLADWLRDVPPYERVRFATVALDEMANSYEEELRLAAGDRRVVRDPGAVRRWRAAARATIERSRALSATLLPHDNVRLFLGPGESLRFVLHGRSIMVDAPRLSGPRTLGERIVARYCARVVCPDIFEPARQAGPREHLWSGWSFSGRQPVFVETAIGLGFRFGDRSALASRKQVCDALVAALVDGAARLAWFRSRGAVLEWDAFHLAERPGGGGSVLVLNRYGDYLELAPEYYRVPREPLVAWFRARLSGGRYEYVFDAAGDIFAAGVPP